MISINTTFPATGFADTRQGGRKENQDTCAWRDTALGLAVTVCDGMGGGPSGKTASTIAADAICKTLSACAPTDNRIEAVRTSIINANHAIYAAMEADPSLQGMGTTATVVLLNNHSAVIGHVGDSRVYQFRDGNKVFRTFDHSWVFEQVRQGTLTEEQARNSSQSNIITRALGHTPELEVDVTEVPYLKGDRFMLCSDGIWGMFPEPDIIRMAARTSSLAGAVESLVVTVDEEGMKTGATHDNLTVALVETTTDSKLKDKMSKKFKYALAALAVLLAASVAINIVQWTKWPGSQPAPESAAVATPDSLKVAGDSVMALQVDSLKKKMAQYEIVQREYVNTVDSLIKLIKAKEVEKADTVLQAEKKKLTVAKTPAPSQK